MNKNTANYGAAQTRASIKRHITRLRKWRNVEVSDVLNELVDFINGLATRAGKRTGGLGRK